MLTCKECAELWGLNADKLPGLKACNGMLSAEARTYFEIMSATPEGCRQILKLMYEQLERIEFESDEQRTREAYKAINHFVATHRFI